MPVSLWASLLFFAYSIVVLPDGSADNAVVVVVVAPAVAQIW